MQQNLPLADKVLNMSEKVQKGVQSGIKLEGD